MQVETKAKASRLRKTTNYYCLALCVFQLTEDRRGVGICLKESLYLFMCESEEYSLLLVQDSLNLGLPKQTTH